MIYLDHNSTTPIAPEAAAAMAACHAEGLANPASQHAAGRKARRRLEDARDGLANLLGLTWGGSRPDRLVFASGGTEANNLAIFGLPQGAPGRIVSSPMEHPSVLGPLRVLAALGWQIDYARVSPEGVVDVEHVLSLLSPDVRLVSLMLANNETGVWQPIAPIAQACRRVGVPLHTDAVQAVGKLPVDFNSLGVDALTFAAHKFHGPPGIGGLALRQGVTLQPQLYGGFQQQGLRPGSECVALTAGMHAALALWREQGDRVAARLARLRDDFERGLRAAGLNIEIHGERSPRLPQTSNIAFLGIDRQAMTMALDLAGVACSTGSACASGSSEPSPTLRAMGCSGEVLAGSVRFSLGRDVTAADMAEAARRILKVHNDLKQGRNAGKSPSPGTLSDAISL